MDSDTRAGRNGRIDVGRRGGHAVVGRLALRFLSRGVILWLVFVGGLVLGVSFAPAFVGEPLRASLAALSECRGDLLRRGDGRVTIIHE